MLLQNASIILNSDSVPHQNKRFIARVWIIPCNDILDPISFSDDRKFEYNGEQIIIDDLTPAEAYEEGWSCSRHVLVELTHLMNYIIVWQPF